MELNEIYKIYMDKTVDLIENQQVDPLECAGTMLAQSLSLYKTLLPAGDFDQVITAIADTKDKVQVFKNEQLH